MKIYRLHMQGDNLEASQMSPEPDLEEFNVPSKKSDLVHFLNRNCYR